MTRGARALGRNESILRVRAWGRTSWVEKEIYPAWQLLPRGQRRGIQSPHRKKNPAAVRIGVTTRVGGEGSFSRSMHKGASKGDFCEIMFFRKFGDGT
jgi:hypothetical protein